MCPDLTPEKIFDKWSELHDTDPNEVRREEYIKTLKEFDTELSHTVEEMMCEYDVFYDDFSYEIYRKFREVYGEGKITREEFVEKVKEDGDSTLLIAYYDMVNTRRKYQEMVKQSMKKLIPINKKIKK